MHLPQSCTTYLYLQLLLCRVIEQQNVRHALEVLGGWLSREHNMEVEDLVLKCSSQEAEIAQLTRQVSVCGFSMSDAHHNIHCNC